MSVTLPRLLLFLLLAGQARGQEYWWVSTRASPQILGADPLLQAFRLDPQQRLSRRDPAELVAHATHRPLIVLVHGSYYTARAAVAEGLLIRGDLAPVMPADAIVVAFDWPSQITRPNLVKDGNEKARRSFVAGYHLARFLQGFPPGSRACLIGHSHGGTAVLAALHLLGGGVLDDGERATCLPYAAPPLRLRAVVIASAADRHWLLPGQRLDRALPASEGILSLYNRLDPVLVVHPLGRYSDHRRALGKAGTPWSADPRYCERAIGGLLGARHTFRGATANPIIARWIGPYTCF